MKYIRNIILVLAAAVLFPIAAIAETHITNPYAIINGSFWSKSGSPYILDTSLYITKGNSLYIDKGVTVLSGTTTSTGVAGEPKSIIILNGSFVASGTAEEPVHILGLGLFSAENATVTASHTDFELKRGARLLRSIGTFDNVTFTNTTSTVAALSLRGSRVNIANSEFSNNLTAIYSFFLPNGIFPARINKTSGDFGIGGIGNALDIVDPTQNQISVHNSMIYDNQRFAIFNETVNTIDARNNWWGISTESVGPTTTSTNRFLYGNTIYGPTDISDWKHERPARLAVKPSCCSSTLFLPGIQASRLYLDEYSLVGSQTDPSINQLWEPNRNEDVRKLFMNSSGESIRDSIYTKDIIDGGFGYKIYDAFISMMNGLVADGKIREWLPFAYDWRADVGEVVSERIQYATTTKSLVEDIIKMASSSPTGKVNIVAHSNGGLVAKMLGKHLEELGKSELVDKVIFVAVPQWGTPQAIAGMLHGDNQSLGRGLILSQGVARSLGLNMPSAYGLLPSVEFFKHVSGPVVTIASTTKDNVLSQIRLSDHDSLTAYLSGILEKRTQPSESDTESPAVLSSTLLSAADFIHSEIDRWKFPTSTKVFSIAGWGTPTTKTIHYGIDTVTKTLTNFGDGTVLTSAAGGYATGLASSTIYFDQNSNTNSAGKKISVEHANILQSGSVREIIASLISTSTRAVSLPPGMSYTLPPITSESWTTLGIHSPVDIDVYDNVGGHIGIIPHPDPTSDLMWLDNTIPGAIYDSIGDIKYITLPVSASTTYSVKLKGTGNGTFTFTIDQTLADHPVLSRTYRDLPVTPLLLADVQVGSLVDLEHATISASSTVPGGVYIDLASTTPPILHLDVDGNGATDISVNHGTSTNLFLHIESMKIIIKSLDLRKNTKKQLLARIDKVEESMRKGKSDKSITSIKQILERLEDDSKKHWKLKQISEQDRTSILATFEILLAALERL